MKYDDMVNIFDICSVSFSYPDSTDDILNNVSFKVDKGDFVVICGALGCGKTTLLRHLKPQVRPVGSFSGKILYEGKNIFDDANEDIMRRYSSEIGYVSQEADSQLVTDTVWHELAFGLESLGCDNMIIRKRVAECASFFDIQNIFNSKTHSLSGGQKQLVNLASIMVMQPKIIILDEPTSKLDPISAGKLIEMLGRINRETGTTIIISEHRLEELLGLCNRVIIMDNGRIVSNSDVDGAASYLYENESIYCGNAAISISGLLGEREHFPLSVCEARKWLTDYMYNNSDNSLNEVNLRMTSEEKDTDIKDTAINIKDIWFRYNKSVIDVLKGLTLSIPKGTIYAVVGGNAVGKSTLLSVISGIDKQYRGRINIDKDLSLAYIPQTPELMFSEESVEKELLKAKQLNENITDTELSDIIGVCRLNKLLYRNPFDLSGGEKQQLAIAKTLVADRDIILMDEPSKGMDSMYKVQFGTILKNLTKAGKTIMLVSHDLDFCACYADRCGMLFDGIITAEEETKKFFLDNSYYTTTVVMMTRGIIEGCVTIQDVAASVGCTLKANESLSKIKDVNIKDKNINDVNLKDDIDYTHQENNIKSKIKMKENGTGNSVDKRKQHLNGRVFMLITYFIIMPLTVWAGFSLLNDRKYYFVSLVLILEAMIPVFANFERNKPGIKKVVIISVMCAVCVAGRQAFYMLPGCKPVVALVVISGVSLGAESGFIIGAMTMLISNIFFGQGPWTPWQMFAMGLAGMVAGLIFYRREKSESSRIRNKSVIWSAKVAIVGAAISFIIYSGIVNLCMPFTIQAGISAEIIAAAYISGLPFDILQACTTAVVLFLIADPMIRRIRRVIQK